MHGRQVVIRVIFQASEMHLVAVHPSCQELTPQPVRKGVRHAPVLVRRADGKETARRQVGNLRSEGTGRRDAVRMAHRFRSPCRPCAVLGNRTPQRGSLVKRLRIRAGIAAVLAHGSRLQGGDVHVSPVTRVLHPEPGTEFPPLAVVFLPRHQVFLRGRNADIGGLDGSSQPIVIGDLPP